MNMLNRGYWVTTLLSVVGARDHDRRDDADERRRPAPTASRRGSASSPPASSASRPASPSSTSPSTTRPARTARSARSPRRRRPVRRRTSSAARRSASRRPRSPRSRSASPSSPATGSASRPTCVSADGRNVGGIFGTAVATMGMLMTTAYILAMDTFGPITDNAGGIAEFSRAEAGAREITDRLDAVGNTTKALTKGYAIASASLAAFLLFSAYIDKINLIQGRRLAGRCPGAELLNSVNLANVSVFIAALLARDARLLLQLAGDPRGRHDGPVDHRRGPPPVPRDARDHGLHPAAGLRPRRRHHDPGRAPPDGRCRASSRSPRRSSSALLLGFEAVAGMLMVGTISGVLLATVLNNGGGAWDNAKKYIESGNLKDDNGNVLGKELRRPCRGRRRRHGRRPVQGHRRPVAPRPREAARDDHARPRPALHPLAHSRDRPQAHRWTAGRWIPLVAGHHHGDRPGTHRVPADLVSPAT